MNILLVAVLLVATVSLTWAGDNNNTKHYVIKVTSEDTARQVDFGASYLLSGESHRYTQLDVKKTPFRLDVDAEVLYLIAQAVTLDVMMKVEVLWVDSLGNEKSWGSVTSKNGIAAVIDYGSGCENPEGMHERKIGFDPTPL